MNKRLLSLFVSLLALSGTLTAVMAIGGESEQTLPVAPISGGDLKARVFDLRTEWDIGIDQYWGGDPSDLPNPSELRANEYMFTGEQKRIYFLVRDLNGAEDISSAKLGWMEGEERFTPVLCNIKPANTIVDNGQEKTLQQLANEFPIPAWGGAPQGYSSLTDKFFECTLTVGQTTEWMGEKTLQLFVYRDGGEDANDKTLVQNVYFNPAVIIDLDTNNDAQAIQWEPETSPNQVVYSANKLIVKNMAEGGVDLWAWISMNDFRDTTGLPSKCPVSNVFDVDADTYGVEYRSKIGTQPLSDWEKMTNPQSDGSCVFNGRCRNSKQIMGEPSSFFQNMIGAGQSAEIEFRYSKPTPCIGLFSQGQVHVVVRAI